MKRWVHTMSNTTQTLRIARTYLCHTGSTKAQEREQCNRGHRSGPTARSGVTPSFTLCYIDEKMGTNHESNDTNSTERTHAFVPLRQY